MPMYDEHSKRELKMKINEVQKKTQHFKMMFDQRCCSYKKEFSQTHHLNFPTRNNGLMQEDDFKKLFRKISKITEKEKERFIDKQ